MKKYIHVNQNPNGAVMSKEELIAIIKNLPDGKIEYFHYAPKLKSQRIKVV